ncbi:MAG: PilZ domain-containing protein [Spirochaetes bacterium]|nr:PilZ domain-containing protein [Spirochaetota bacterium]
MNEKRKYQRFPCNIKADFDYYEGNPEEIDINMTIPIKGKGTILDISKGGLFLVSNSRVGVAMPIIVKFSTKKNKYELKGTIVRTGLIKNNPSELAQKFASLDTKGDSYIAVEFDELLESLEVSEL